MILHSFPLGSLVAKERNTERMYYKTKTMLLARAQISILCLLSSLTLKMHFSAVGAIVLATFCATARAWEGDYHASHISNSQLCD
jgi:hypothetical protein